MACLLSEQKINRYIKDIGQMAEINDKIEVKESRGGSGDQVL